MMPEGMNKSDHAFHKHLTKKVQLWGVCRVKG